MPRFTLRVPNSVMGEQPFHWISRFIAETILPEICYFAMINYYIATPRAAASAITAFSDATSRSRICTPETRRARFTADWSPMTPGDDYTVSRFRHFTTCL